MKSMVVLGLTGCACNTAERAWLKDNGGTLTGPRQARVERLATTFSDTAVGRRARVSVLNSDALSAFSWRSGHIFLARGLIDALTDDELRAVLAHELGHLVNDGPARPIESLNGPTPDSSTDIERQADLTGLRLLQQHHIAPRPMLTMLRKVQHDPHLAPEARVAIARRITLLEQTR